jgi:hypothetical protein
LLSAKFMHKPISNSDFRPLHGEFHHYSWYDTSNEGYNIALLHAWYVYKTFVNLAKVLVVWFLECECRKGKLYWYMRKRQQSRYVDCVLKAKMITRGWMGTSKKENKTKLYTMNEKVD